MNSDNSKIIQPGIIHPGSRANRRISLIDANKRLIELNGRQVKLIQANNKLLTDIATIIGVPLPQTPEEGAEAVQKIKERIKGLVKKRNARFLRK